MLAPFWISFVLLLVLPVALLSAYGQGLAWVATNLALWGGGATVRTAVYGLYALLILLFAGHSVWAVQIALDSELGAIARFAPSVALLLLVVRPAVLVLPALSGVIGVARVRSWLRAPKGRRRHE